MFHVHFDRISRAKLRSVNRAHEPSDFRLSWVWPPWMGDSPSSKGQTCRRKEGLDALTQHHALACETLVFSYVGILTLLSA